MPHIESLKPKKHEFPILFGQNPLTKFKDYRSSIRVELLNPEPRDQMMKRLYQFAKATWADSPIQNETATDEEMSKALNSMLSGKALGLGLEATNLTFRISGISRIDLQQIVRQRIGVVYSVQCTGDRMLHHNDILVEESIAGHPNQYQNFIDSTITAKMSYASMIDEMISLQVARGILPQVTEIFMFMNTNISTLLFFHQKRIDDGSQTWQMNVIAQQMADRVCEVYPEMKEVFEKNKTKFKFQKEASADRENTFSTGLYLPKEDSFDYNDRDFLYQKTKEEMHFTGTPTPNRYFWGFKEISEVRYTHIKEEYKKWSDSIDGFHLTNEQILEHGKELTQDLLDELNAHEN